MISDVNCDESRNLRIRKETFIPARAYDFTEILKRLHMIAVGPCGKASASSFVILALCFKDSLFSRRA